MKKWYLIPCFFIMAISFIVFMMEEKKKGDYDLIEEKEQDILEKSTFTKDMALLNAYVGHIDASVTFEQENQLQGKTGKEVIIISNLQEAIIQLNKYLDHMPQSGHAWLNKWFFSIDSEAIQKSIPNFNTLSSKEKTIIRKKILKIKNDIGQSVFTRAKQTILETNKEDLNFLQSYFQAKDLDTVLSKINDMAPSSHPLRAIPKELFAYVTSYLPSWQHLDRQYYVYMKSKALQQLSNLIVKLIGKQFKTESVNAELQKLPSYIEQNIKLKFVLANPPIYSSTTQLSNDIVTAHFITNDRILVATSNNLFLVFSENHVFQGSKLVSVSEPEQKISFAGIISIDSYRGYILLLKKDSVFILECKDYDFNEFTYYHISHSLTEVKKIYFYNTNKYIIIQTENSIFLYDSQHFNLISQYHLPENESFTFSILQNKNLFTDRKTQNSLLFLLHNTELNPIELKFKSIAHTRAFCNNRSDIRIIKKGPEEYAISYLMEETFLGKIPFLLLSSQFPLLFSPSGFQILNIADQYLTLINLDSFEYAFKSQLSKKSWFQRYKWPITAGSIVGATALSGLLHRYFQQKK